MYSQWITGTHTAHVNMKAKKNPFNARLYLSCTLSYLRYISVEKELKWEAPDGDEMVACVLIYSSVSATVKEQ